MKRRQKDKVQKQHLVDRVAQQTGLSQETVLQGVEEMFTTMSQAMEAGERVTLTNFGSFRVSRRGQRVGRNMQTGEAVPIPPRRVVKFVGGRRLLHKLCD